MVRLVWLSTRTEPYHKKCAVPPCHIGDFSRIPQLNFSLIINITIRLIFNTYAFKRSVALILMLSILWYNFNFGRSKVELASGPFQGERASNLIEMRRRKL